MVEAPRVFLSAFRSSLSFRVFFAAEHCAFSLFPFFSSFLRRLEVIPERYRDMISPQPHFMASFLDPRTGHVWPSAVFGVPGFADPDASDGRRGFRGGVTKGRGPPKGGGGSR